MIMIICVIIDLSIGPLPPAKQLRGYYWKAGFSVPQREGGRERGGHADNSSSSSMFSVFFFPF